MTPLWPIATALVSFHLLGCAPRGPMIEPKEFQERFFTHTVTLPNENLSLLAQWYTDNWKNWRYFFIPAYSGAVRKLKRGDEVLVPYSLAKKTTPPTEDYIQSHQRGTALSPQRSVKKEETPSSESSSTAPEASLPEEIEEDAAPPETTLPSDLESEFLTQMINKNEKQKP